LGKKILKKEFELGIALFTRWGDSTQPGWKRGSRKGNFQREAGVLAVRVSNYQENYQQGYDEYVGKRAGPFGKEKTGRMIV